MSVETGYSSPIEDMLRADLHKVRAAYASEGEDYDWGHIGIMPAGEAVDDTGNRAYNQHVAVRYFPADHHLRIPPTPHEAEQLIDDAQEHFNVLRDAGIEVPTVIFAQETPEAPHTRIISFVDRVEGRQFTNHDIWEEQGNTAPFQDEAVILAHGLLKYYRWVLTENKTHFLSDISGLYQAIVPGAGRVALIDTDPIMMETFPASPRSNDLSLRLTKLEWWVNCLQRPHDAIDLLDQINTLQSLYVEKAAIAQAASMVGDFSFYDPGNNVNIFVPSRYAA
jgi:hypothetical protein